MNGTELNEPLQYVDEEKNINDKFETRLNTLFPEDKTFRSFDWLLKHRFERLNDNYWMKNIHVGYLKSENPREGDRLYVQVEAHRKEYFKDGVWVDSNWLVRIKKNNEEGWTESKEFTDVRECLLDVQKRIYRMMEELNRLMCVVIIKK